MAADMIHFPMYRSGIAWMSAAALLVGGCTTDRIAAPDAGAVPALPRPLADPARLIVPTYDGSGQAVEPDVLYFATAWHGWTYWMVMAPYPAGDGRMENPSILVSQNGRQWVVPPGVSNPIVGPPANGINSDPTLLYDRRSDRLVVSYREVSGGLNSINGTSSPDGISWSPPRRFFSAAQHNIVGQTLTMRDGVRPVAWSVNSGPSGCSSRSSRLERRVGTGVAAVGPAATRASWSPPSVVALSQPGFVIWHINIVYVPEKQEYWAVYAAYRPADGCGKCELFFARSSDGETWRTYSGPFLRTGFSGWSDASLYAASLVFNSSSDRLTVWFSARSRTDVWSLGIVEYPFADFLRTMQTRRTTY